MGKKYTGGPSNCDGGDGFLEPPDFGNLNLPDLTEQFIGYERPDIPKTKELDLREEAKAAPLYRPNHMKWPRASVRQRYLLPAEYFDIDGILSISRKIGPARPKASAEY